MFRSHSSLSAGPVEALLASLIENPEQPFAVLRRAGGPGIEVLVGDLVEVARLSDLPLPVGDLPVLALVPFRQVAERGFECHDDGTPLQALVARQYGVLDQERARALLPSEEVTLTDGHFDLDDDAYGDVVKRVIAEEIGRGEGANFVVRRDFLATQGLPPATAVLALLGRLLDTEPAAYWTFAIHTPQLSMAGATPERHVSMEAGVVLMNPISGTYRYPAHGPSAAGLLEFLADRKETEELFMVVDEELKMMSQVCERGGQVLGPYLRPMSRLAHTEYLLSGVSSADPREVLRATMFAATVTGSPVQNACRVIARHERTGRGYYAGVAALLTNRLGCRDGEDGDADGVDLDAPILIRTAYLSPNGAVRVPVGATLVRHSVPEAEVAETHAKVAAVLGAFGAANRSVEPAESADTVGPADLAGLPGVAEALARRNAGLARFWLEPQTGRPVAALTGRSALIIDAEDDWTAMLAHLLRRLGMTARVQRWNAVTPDELDRADLVVAGPGPGDPRRLDEPRIGALHAMIEGRRATRRPLLAVCLSHQILAGALGLPVAPLAEPYQGTQRRVIIDGRPADVGFYNTYAAMRPRTPPDDVTIWDDVASGEVFGLRGPGFASVQFHLESVLSTSGVDLLSELVQGVLGDG